MIHRRRLADTIQAANTTTPLSNRKFGATMSPPAEQSICAHSPFPVEAVPSSMHSECLSDASTVGFPRQSVVA